MIQNLLEKPKKLKLSNTTNPKTDVGRSSSLGGQWTGNREHNTRDLRSVSPV